MTGPAIRVEGLWKEYTRGARNAAAGSVREAIANALTAPARRLRHLSGRVPDTERFWALRDLIFELREGEVVGIIGRNGAGKSTLLKILSRITAPTRGRVEIHGRVASLLEVGTGFHPDLTGRENIFLNCAIFGMKRHEVLTRFDAIVDFSGIEKFLDTPVKRYSSGMYVRLAFSVAAHLEPDVLILDEVLAVGDADFQARCLGKMGDVARAGRTVLFVSHNMAAVKALCSRALLLHGGTIQQDGSSDAVVAAHLSSSELRATTDQDRFPVFNDEHQVGISRFSAHVEATSTKDQTLTVRLSIRSAAKKRGIGVGFQITSPTGVKVASIAPVMTGFQMDLSPGETPCLFRVNNLGSALAGGKYLIGVWLAIPGVELVVGVEDAGIISVRPEDCYGRGVPFDSERYGVVPLRASFQPDTGSLP